MDKTERILLGEKPKIRFSHRYFKLPASNSATLIICREVKLEEQMPAFLQFDTQFKAGDGTLDWYPLPEKGGYLLLAFISRTGAFFTTLRRATPQKTKYYKGLVGREFEVVVGDEDGAKM